MCAYCMYIHVHVIYKSAVCGVLSKEFTCTYVYINVLLMYNVPFVL